MTRTITLTVPGVIGLMGQGMRLCVPDDGSPATLIEGFPSFKRTSIEVPVEITAELMKRPDVCKMQREPEYGKVNGKPQIILDGWGSFYAGKPACIYCLVQ